MSNAAEFWDRQAATFDAEPDHGLRDAVVRAAWDRLLRDQLPARACAVADLGCGTGSLAVLMASAGHMVTGLDIAPRMVQVARDKARFAGVDARFLVGDAATPGLAQGAFDVVLARHVLWAMPDVDAALETWVGLLSAGGRVVLVEGRWHTGSGLTASDTLAAVRRHRRRAVVTPLTDPQLWGGPVTDERYLLVSEE